MVRGVRAAVVLAALLSSAACGGGDDTGDGTESLTRDEGVDVLVAQGYTPEGAACIIDNADDQDADVLDILTRDQVTQRELQVLATIQEFCLRTLGSGATVPAPPTTPATIAPTTEPG